MGREAARMEEAVENQRRRIEGAMKKIKRKIMVLSGKGGVRKSTVTVNLAAILAVRYGPETIGILDADITGPSIPKMLGIRGERLGVGLQEFSQRLAPLE